ncbi:hypothetical protein C0992_002852 [Termitomyces sp. T32_za158]|nr:hypothetical protein C0992_002852 [Termitomyces sp. T32_za158]
METFSFAQFGREVHVALYRYVTNAGEIRKKIVAGARFGYLDARLTAIYQALLAESQGALRTRSVHTEVLWALNPTNNITEGLRRYGVSEQTAAVIVVSMDGTSESLGAGIAGTLVGLDALGELTDWERVCKVNANVFYYEI